MKTDLYIKERVPEEKQEKLTFENHTWAWSKYAFYDPEKHICFRVFEEPGWLHMEDGKIYDFTFEDECDTDTYCYKVYQRLGDNLVIMAEDYGNGFITIDEGYLGEGWPKMTIGEYLSVRETEDLSL